MDAFKPLLAKVATGASLTTAEARTAFDCMLSGEVTPAQMGGFLMALRVRGETVAEITGAVTAMRARMLRVEAPDGAIDVVGTGGDGAGSYNVSTLAALIVAACGVPVAKHGNRAATSKSGSSDVLTALGVKIGIEPDAVSRCVREAGIGFMMAQTHHAAMRHVGPARVELGVKIGIEPDAVSRCVREAGIGFMMAQTHHAAMRHVGPARVELGTRTIFNLLGPLSNPAGVTRQLLGVFSPQWLEPLAEVLRALGSHRVWVMHGSDGLDEITTTGPTEVVELRQGKLRRFQVSPEDIGVARATASDLKGGDPAHNATALNGVLAGARGAYRDIAILNAAAALVVADKAQTLQDGAALAAKAIDSGAARATLANLVRISNE